MTDGTKCHVNVMEVNYLGIPNMPFASKSPPEKRRKSASELGYTEKCKELGGLHSPLVCAFGLEYQSLRVVKIGAKRDSRRLKWQLLDAF